MKLSVPGREARSAKSNAMHEASSRNRHSDDRPLVLVGPTSRYSVTGLSVAFEMLLEGLEDRGIPHVLVDASPAKRESGVLSRGRIAEVAALLLRVAIQLRRAKLVYVTMGGSTLGFIRDLTIIELARAFRVPTVFHFHGGGYDEFYDRRGPLLRALIRRTLRRIDRIIVLSEGLRGQFGFVDRPGGPAIDVVLNGLPAEVAERATPRVIREEEPVRLAYLSNMIPSKGYLKLLGALEILKTRGVRAEGEFAGEFMKVGSEGDSLEPSVAERDFLARIDTAGLAESVKYLGRVRGAEKRDMLESAHLFVLPTEYPGEGLPISIVEALSQGIPVIATNYRGIPEQVEHGVNGWLLETSTPEAIAHAVESIAGDPDLYSEMSRNARRTYEEKFTRDRHLDALIGVIQSAVGPESTPSRAQV